MSAHLVTCPACSRHVRVSEESCPFCNSELSAELRARPERQGPAVRLSRVALAAFSAGALVVPTACSSSSPSTMAGEPIPAYGVVFPGPYTVGEACTGKEYVEELTGDGFLICYDGQWTYTTVDPADAGYTLAPLDAGDDSGDDATDDSGVTDATTDPRD
jgi:hypothetical protein